MAMPNEVLVRFGQWDTILAAPRCSSPFPHGEMRFVRFRPPTPVPLPYGGFASFDDRSTLATWLRAAASPSSARPWPALTQNSADSPSM